MKLNCELIAFVVIAAVLTTRCTPDVPEPDINPVKGGTVSLAQDTGLQKIVSGLRASQGMISTANNEERDIYADADWEHVSKLEDTRPEYDRTLYAAFLKSTMTGSTLENLIMAHVNGKDIQFIMRYKAEADWFLYNTLKENMSSFTGTIEFVAMDGAVFAKSAFQDGVSYIPQRGGSSDDCDTWVTTEYSDVVSSGDGLWDVEFVYWTVTEFVPCPWAADPIILIAPEGNPDSGVGGPALPISEVDHLQTPCPGNPLPSMAIAKQKKSGKKGGRYGYTRTKKLPSGELVPKWHGGLDLKTRFGDPIYSMFAGTVVQVNTIENDLGNFVVVRSNINGRDVYHYYGHLQSPTITVGTIVGSGSQLGRSGSSGNLGNAVILGTTEQHVHVIIRDTSVSSTHPRGAKVDPEDFLTAQFDSNGNRTDSQIDCQEISISSS